MWGAFVVAAWPNMLVAKHSRLFTADLVERLGDGRRGRGRLLPRLKRHDIHHKRRGREPIDPPIGPDDASQRARYKEPVRDPV